MNRFDRVTSLLLMLQTKSVITAQFLSEHFDVSERTIYRDIRTLENAGVPIGSEAGVGYFLQQGYRLPPVSFTLDEAASLLLGEKLLASSLDANSLQDFKQALNKIKSVIDSSDKDYLNAFSDDIEVRPTGSQFPLDDGQPANNLEDGQTTSDDRWLRECRAALLHRQVIKIEYAALSNQKSSERLIEPIGIFYYSWHWHLIAWCRLRQAYRDFRLDRIASFAPLAEQFMRRSRLTLQQYLSEQPGQEELISVQLLFQPGAARFVQEQRYMFGFVDEELLADKVKMRFLTHIPEYMARWLLQYGDGVQVIEGEVIKQLLQEFSVELHNHWANN